MKWKLFFIFTLFFYSSSLFAYNFLYIHPTTGQPIGWEAGTTIHYWVDPGPLGRLTNEQARTLLRAAMDIWENASPNANVPHFQYEGLLPEDVNGGNYQEYVSLRSCSTADLSSCSTQSQKDLKTIIIFDDDSSILNSSVCSYAGCLAYADARVFDGVSADHTTIAQGIVIYGGEIVSDSPSLGAGVYHTVGVMVHELGHLLGLAHTVINQEINIENLWDTKKSYLPTMLSIEFVTDSSGMGERDQVTLNPDDIAGISTLYSSSTFSQNTGVIKGTITKSDGTPMMHANLIARNLEDPLCETYSFLSGRICPLGYQSGGGNSCLNIIDPLNALYEVGDYTISGLPSGSYTLEVEEIEDDFLASSYVPALYNVFLDGDAEFWNENDVANESNTLSSNITLSVGEIKENINIILNRSVVTNDRIKYIPLSTFSSTSNYGCQSTTINYATLLGIQSPEGLPTPTQTSSAGGCSLIDR